MGFVQGLQLCPFVVGQNEIECGHRVVDVMQLGRTDDRGCAPRPPATPASATCARGTCLSAAILATCSTITGSQGAVEVESSCSEA
jgi:hypothetical protein